MRKIWSTWSVQMKKYVPKKWSDKKLHPCTIRFKHTEIRPDIKDVSLKVPINMMCCSPCYRWFSLCSKLSVWFRSKKDRVTGFSIAKTIAKKWKGGRGRKETRFHIFFPATCPFFYSRQFRRGLWRSFFVLCSETKRKACYAGYCYCQRSIIIWHLWCRLLTWFTVLFKGVSRFLRCKDRGIWNGQQQ